MKAPQTLRRPANWQDFESLCKKLWGEAWNCPEIQKNGRLGQEQSGVDVFGVPAGETEYWGIQCKGKSEYNDGHPQFTEDEITKEIEKAKTFEPKLKKFYLATTAINDAKIQAFVRQKHIEHIKAGLFEIHLFCWESIVDLIDENKATHDWYIKSQNFKSNKSVKLTFEDDSTVLTKTVKFQQKVTMYLQEELPTPASLKSYFAAQDKLSILSAAYRSPFESSKVNYTNCFFGLRLHNTGLDAIENYKVQLRLEGRFREVERAEETTGLGMISLRNQPYDTYIENDGTGVLIPANKILVGDDTRLFDEIRIKPYPDESDIIIHWKLISKDYKEEGHITLHIIPEIIKQRKSIVSPEKAGTSVVGEIEDYITEKK